MPTLWCENCQIVGKHATNNYHLLQKYTKNSQQLFCNFCRSVGNNERTCRSYELMMHRTPTYRFQEKSIAPWPDHRNGVNMILGARTRLRWRRTWKRSRTVDMLQLHRARTLCPWLHKHNAPSCLYFTLIDHEIEYCPTLIVRVHDKGVLLPPPTQNLQMMRSKPHMEDPNVNIVL